MTPAPASRVRVAHVITWSDRREAHENDVNARLADLPGNYLNWFAREGFPRGELGQLLALMHEIDHNGLSDLITPLRGR